MTTNSHDGVKGLVVGSEIQSQYNDIIINSISIVHSPHPKAQYTINSQICFNKESVPLMMQQIYVAVVQKTTFFISFMKIFRIWSPGEVHISNSSKKIFLMIIKHSNTSTSRLSFKTLSQAYGSSAYGTFQSHYMMILSR